MHALPRDARCPGPVRGPATRARLPALLALAAVLAACGGRPASPSTPSASPPAAESSSAATPAGNPGQPAPAADPAPAAESGAGAAGAVTEAECQTLLAHVVAVANRAHVQTVSPEAAPTDAQLAEIRARMAPEFIPVCLGLSRAALACQLRASTRDELVACL